jgi:hypothetical protein
MVIEMAKNITSTLLFIVIWLYPTKWKNKFPYLYHNMVRRRKHFVPTLLMMVMTTAALRISLKSRVNHSLTLITLSAVGTTCFSSCCDKDSAIIFTTRRLPERQPSLEMDRVLKTANAASTNGLTCLPKHGGARDNKFWSPIR